MNKQTIFNTKRFFTMLGLAVLTLAILASTVSSVSAQEAYPTVVIDSGPTNPSPSTEATFTFHSEPDGAAFECSIITSIFASPDWQPCTSPHTVTGLSDGSGYFFLVKSQGAPNTNPTMALYGWSIDVDMILAVAVLDTYPEDPTYDTEATFTFHTFPAADTPTQCAFINGTSAPALSDWYSCTSPQTFTNLTRQNFYTFYVKAEGQRDQYIQQWGFVVNVPVLTIDSADPDPNTTQATFTFHTTPATTIDVPLECAFGYKNGPTPTWTDCTSPQVFTDLIPAYSYYFVVRVKGYLESMVGRQWTVAIPTVVIDSGPSGTSFGTEATFTFHSDPAGAQLVCALASDGLSPTNWEDCTSSKTYTNLIPSTLYLFAVMPKGAPESSAITRSFTVADKQNQAITFGQLEGKIYGDDPFTVSATAGSGLPVSFSAAGSCTIVDSTVTITGAGSCTITASQSGDDQWNAADPVEQAFSIAKKTATVTAANQSKAYGDLNPVLTGTVTGQVAGDAINFTLSTLATSLSGVGEYPITIDLGSNPNYDVTSTDGILTINPRAASVRAVNVFKTYGDENPALTGAVTGAVEGGDVINFSLSTEATRISGVGTYRIVVTLGSNPNYSVTHYDGILAITQKAVQIAANPTNRIYGEETPPLTATVTGEVAGADRVNYILAAPADRLSDVGSYPIIVDPGGNRNYIVTATTKSELTIIPKAASVTATDQTKTYGDDNPVLTVTVIGEVAGGDPIIFYQFTEATKLSNVGSYPINITLPHNHNYNVTAINGTLSIIQKAASITADSLIKIYGDDNPALTALVTGEAAGGDPINYSLSTTAMKFSDVGIYPITVIPGDNPNYSVAVINGNLEIEHKAASITAHDQTKTYGDDNPALTVTVTGQVEGGDPITFLPLTGADKLSNVGSYPIVIYLSINPNYHVIPVDGTLSIVQKAAIVTADSMDKTYGEDNPALTATVTGEVVDGDAINYRLYTAAGQISGVGNYPITVTPGSNPNYSVKVTDGTLSIGQKAANVTADSTSKTYGDDNPDLTANVAGQVLGGDFINYSLSTTAGKLSGVGDFPISVTLGSNPNYSVTAFDGTLSIGQKDATVTTVSISKTYGDDNPNLAAKVVGQVEGGDVINYSLSTTAEKFSVVGDYPITVTPGSNPNYSVTATDGTLSIIQKAATVTADDKTKIYGEDNPGLTAIVEGQVDGGDAIKYSLSTTATKSSAAGSYPITVTAGSNPNYSITGINGTLTIDPREGVTSYIGQDLFMTAGSSSSTAKVTLTASIQDPDGAGSVANATVTFKDLLSGKILASGVPVSLVSNTDTSIGTANAAVTLSSGQYGAQEYLIEVSLGGSYENAQQTGAAPGSDAYEAAHMIVTVMIPKTTNTMQASAKLEKLPTAAGLYGDASQVSYTIGMKYNKGGSNPQGQVQLILKRSDGTYYIKSNSITSLTYKVSSTSKDVIIYTKASIYKIDSRGEMISIEGNVTLRVDAHDGGTTGDTIGFTVLSSKSSSLFYSNNWVYDATTLAWKTMQQGVSSKGGMAVVIN